MTARPTLRVDATQLPLIEITVSGAPTAEDCVELFATLNEICESGERVATIVDLRDLNPFAMTAAVRQAAARAFFDGIDSRRARTICEARIAEHVLTRSFLKAFDWITGSKWPCAVFPTREEAVAWVNERVEMDAPMREHSSSGTFAISAELHELITQMAR
jgi:hypothetical protein